MDPSSVRNSAALDADARHILLRKHLERTSLRTQNANFVVEQALSPSIWTWMSSLLSKIILCGMLAFLVTWAFCKANGLIWPEYWPVRLDGASQTWHDRQALAAARYVWSILERPLQFMQWAAIFILRGVYVAIGRAWDSSLVMVDNVAHRIADLQRGISADVSLRLMNIIQDPRLVELWLSYQRTLTRVRKYWVHVAIGLVIVLVIAARLEEAEEVIDRPLYTIHVQRSRSLAPKTHVLTDAVTESPQWYAGESVSYDVRAWRNLRQSSENVRSVEHTTITMTDTSFEALPATKTVASTLTSTEDHDGSSSSEDGVQLQSDCSPKKAVDTAPVTTPAIVRPEHHGPMIFTSTGYQQLDIEASRTDYCHICKQRHSYEILLPRFGFRYEGYPASSYWSTAY